MRARAGYTLVEVAIGTAVGSLLTLAAITFASFQTRQLGLTNETLDLSQSARAGIDRLKADLRIAGAGVGYTSAGTFAGLELGTFTRDTATFQTSNLLISTTYGNRVTDDLGIVHANGDFATIAAYSPSGTAQLCRGSNLAPGDVVLFRSEDGISARTVRIKTMQLGVCSRGQCLGGCDDVVWEADSSYLSGTEALTAPYAGGEASGDFTRITWFVETTDPAHPDIGRLRRAVGDCQQRDHTCGEVVLDNVEALHFRVYQRDRTGWQDLTASTTGLTSRDRVRVDIEIVVRAQTPDRQRQQLPAVLELESSMCFPACGTKDHFARRVARTSVEIRNSGRMTYRRRS